MQKAMMLIEPENYVEFQNKLEEFKEEVFFEDVYRTVIPVTGYLLKVHFEDTEDIEMLMDFLHNVYHCAVVYTIVFEDERRPFLEWLEEHVNDDVVYGDLLYDMQHDPGFPAKADNKREILARMRRKHACDEALEAFNQAYEAYIKE